jgi:hypothetical protein
MAAAAMPLELHCCGSHAVNLGTGGTTVGEEVPALNRSQ